MALNNFKCNHLMSLQHFKGLIPPVHRLSWLPVGPSAHVEQYHAFRWIVLHGVHLGR